MVTITTVRIELTFHIMDSVTISLNILKSRGVNVKKYESAGVENALFLFFF